MLGCENGITLFITVTFIVCCATIIFPFRAFAAGVITIDADGNGGVSASVTIYDTGNSGISSTGWYFRSINNRSSSWSGVVNLYSFLTTNTTNTTKGPAGS